MAYMYLLISWIQGVSIWLSRKRESQFLEEPARLHNLAGLVVRDDVLVVELVKRLAVPTPFGGVPPCTELPMHVSGPASIAIRLAVSYG